VLHISDANNLQRFDLRRALGLLRAAESISATKLRIKDSVQVYLGVIQNRNIEIDGFQPIYTPIIATSNYSTVRRKGRAPM
jgi:serine protein kinase